MTTTYITEQCGARWAVSSTNATRSDRAFWVLLVGGRSQAQPGVVGFYAASINAACNALNN